jgi:phage/plasmid-like protein (TIGR03299 family)
MWHGAGVVLDDYPEDWDAARLAAGLMWEPTPKPVYTQHLLTAVQAEALIADGGEAHRIDQPSYSNPDAKYRYMVAESDFQAIARDDTGDVLAVPGSGFKAVTHAQMGEVIEAVLESDQGVKFETAGSCRGGRQVWALAYLDEPYQIGGDSSPIYPFLAFLNGHDGSAACKLPITDVRVVCWNTWNAAAAQGDRTGAQYVFKHVGDISQHIEDAKDALKQVREDSKATRALFEELAKVPVNDDQVKTFTQLFLPSPADKGDFVSERVAGNIAKARAKFIHLHDEAITTDGIRGTAYGLLQASTEYLDHVRGFRSNDTYMGRTLLKPEKLKAEALALIGEITSN